MQCLSLSVWLILFSMLISILLKTESHRGELPRKIVHSKNLRLNVKLLLSYYLKVNFSKLIFFSKHSKGVLYDRIRGEMLGWIFMP